MCRSILKWRQIGLGLIEVMVATVFVALALVALAQVLGVALKSGGESRVRMHALNYAQERLEQLRGFVRHDQYPPVDTTCDPILGATDTGLSADLTRCVTVTACPNSVACRQLQVVVKWTDILGSEQRVTLTSYLAETDPVRGGIVLAR